MNRGTTSTSAHALAQTVAGVVDDTEGVVRRHGGRSGEVATFSGPEPVEGVRVTMAGADCERVRVDVVVQYGHSVPGVADELRRRVADGLRRVTGTSPNRIDVHVRDIEDPDVDEPAGQNRSALSPPDATQ